MAVQPGDAVSSVSACWCGNSELDAYSPDYLRCRRCQTLVRRTRPARGTAKVSDVPGEFYGRDYWFSYQERELGCPNIVVRARTDLSERCLHWLEAALRYKLPPGRVLEIGSGPGGFVAVLQAAGFEATGLELSPSIVRFIRDTFEVPVLLGPVEEQSIEPASLDMIALMDVLEHLPDPAKTMRHCLGLLKPDGCLLIQTPCYVEDRSHEALVAEDDRFLEMLRPEDHLHLFSRRSLRDFFGRLGAESVVFEPALFSEYDMFAVVSHRPLETHGRDAIAAALGARPATRLVQALLDLGRDREALGRRYTEAEADRAARLAALEAQGRALGEAEAERSEARAEAAALRSELQKLEQQVTAIETDREARLHVIQAQGDEIGKLQAQRNDLRAELDALYGQNELIEADRAARLEVIEGQARQLGELEAERNTLQSEVSALRRDLELAERDRAAHLARLDSLYEIVGHIQRSRVFRLLRFLGRWKRVDAGIGRARDER